MGKLSFRKNLFLCFIATGISYFGLIWWRALEFNSNGDLMASPATLWADWALHFSMGSSMAFKNILIKTSPFVIGAPFHYPYLVNLISALLIKSGVPFFSAFVIPSFILSIGLVIGLALFYRSLFKSELAAVLASLIFLLNGGLGFLVVAKDVLNSSHFWNSLFFPVHMATRIEPSHIFFENFLRSLWIPQRSLQLGIPMGLLSLFLILSVIKEKGPSSPWKMPLAGLLFGLLPIAHAHSFGAVGLIAGFWMIGDFLQRPANRFSKFSWILFWAVAFVVAQPLVGVIFKGNSQTGFITFAPGWYVFEVGGNWVWFWIKNWGITPLVAAGGSWLWIRSQLPEKKKTAVFLVLPFAVLFALVNLFKFQPWIWDNTKILVWASLGISGFAGYAVSEFSFSADLKKRAGAGILFILMTTAGFIDAYRLLLPSLNRELFYTKEELELADWVRTRTEPDAVWLTGDRHNNWLYNLTGRQALIGYEGWLWTHGYDYKPVQDDMKTMFKNPGRKDLFERYGVNYITVGPKEIKSNGADAQAFGKIFKLLLETENYKLFICTPPKNHSSES